MPILKREPDQYPPDLMNTEHESLALAETALLASGPNPSPSDYPPDLAEKFGSFGYYTGYLGNEHPTKPLTFWSGDWEDYPQFDPEAAGWWCLYTHSRQEKVLMRHLFNRKVAFYCPMIEKRFRSPHGRMRTSFLPLFTNYVFLRGTDDDRRLALSTNCVLASKPIRQPDYLVHDLWQISVAVATGVPITAEQKLEQGDPVTVKSGPFKGFEGFIIRRAGTTRFLIYLRYLEQGVSMEIDEGALVAT
ncbi:MAG: transcription termination/antitermination NusG family protein [Pirellulaceae bacterium]|nr:transcription termination/antitermination NusG family protein [Pirellulaceae bacterium]